MVEEAVVVVFMLQRGDVSLDEGIEVFEVLHKLSWES